MGIDITEEQMEIINNVIKSISPRYTFYGYELEDIKQEAFIICMDGLRRWDKERPLANFLSVHLSNRLLNFVRDNHYLGSPDENDRKSKIRKPAQLDYEENTSLFEESDNNSLDTKESIEKIDKLIPASMRLDYLKMLNGVTMQTQRKQEIIEKIKEILGR